MSKTCLGARATPEREQQARSNGIDSRATRRDARQREPRIDRYARRRRRGNQLRPKLVRGASAQPPVLPDQTYRRGRGGVRGATSSMAGGRQLERGSS